MELNPVVVASVVGGAASFLGVWLAQSRTAQREREAKEREAKDKRLHEWHQFQLRTLLDLQDAMKLLTVLPFRTMLLSMEPRIEAALANASEYLATIEQTMIDLGTAQINVRILVARVPDGNLVTLVEELCDAAREAGGGGGSAEEETALLGPVMDTFEAANTRISELIAALKPE